MKSMHAYIFMCKQTKRERERERERERKRKRKRKRKREGEREEHTKQSWQTNPEDCCMTAVNMSGNPAGHEQFLLKDVLYGPYSEH